jgi:S1-C subfamily serine protease
MPPPPVPRTTESSGGLSPIRIAVCSGAGLILLLGGLLLFVNLKGGTAPGELIREAKERMDSASNSNDLVAAKRLAKEALLVSGEKHRKEAQDLLDEIEARQTFLDNRVKDLVSQGERELQKGNPDEAGQLADRAAKITMATNHHLATGLIARIEGYKAAQPPPGPSPPDGPDRPSTEKSWADVAEIVKPSVVAIISKCGEDWSGGTGFFVADDIVISNQHVIAKSDPDSMASEVYIKRYTGEISRAQGYLYQNKATDIAILKVARLPSNLKTLDLFEGRVRQGEEVAAMGHPVGLEFTFTMGHVSAIRKGQDLNKTFNMKCDGTWVHHSAPISRGNSGGPLLNKQGNVVAMNTWCFVDNEEFGEVQNLNFAISSGDIREAIDMSDDRVIPFEANASDITRDLRQVFEDILDQ